jgi:hypothetical protein
VNSTSTANVPTEYAIAENDKHQGADQAMLSELNSLIERARSASSADGAAVALRDEQGILCHASTGNAPPLGSRLQPDSIFTMEPFTTGRTAVCQDAKSDPRIDAATAGDLRLRSAAAIPITSPNSILGVLEVFSSRPSAFTSQHITQLQEIAESIARILAGARIECQEPAPDTQPAASAALATSSPEKQQAVPSDIPAAPNRPSELGEAKKRIPQADSSLLGLGTGQEQAESQEQSAKGNSGERLGAIGALLLLFLLCALFLYERSRYLNVSTRPAEAKPSTSSSTPAAVPERKAVGTETQAAINQKSRKESGPAQTIEINPSTVAPRSVKQERESASFSKSTPTVELAAKRSAEKPAERTTPQPTSQATENKMHDQDVRGSGPMLAIEDAPPGAAIFIDNQFSASTDSSGRARIPIAAPGSHQLRLTLNGYRDYQQSLDLQSGRTAAVVAKLVPLTPTGLIEPAKPSIPPIIATTPSEPRPTDVANLAFDLKGTFGAHSGWVTSVAFSADGQRLASGGWDETVKFWEVPSGEKVSTVASKIKAVEALTFSRDGHLLAAENANYVVTIWDGTTGQEIRTLPGNRPSGPGNNWVYSIAFSPDGRWLASGVDNKTVRVWDVATGQPLRDLTGSARSVIYAAFSPNGRWLASGGDDKTIKIWDVSSGRELRTLAGHKKQVYAVAFSPDGRWLASASGDKTVKLWDAVTGVEVRTLAGHRNWVTSLAFSPDGRWLASGSWDNTIKIWDVETGHPVQTLSGQNHHIYTVAFDPGGHWLASGREDGRIELWSVQPVVNRAKFDNNGNH